MKASPKQIGFIKSLQSKAGMDDVAYRAMLNSVTGKTSATELTSVEAARVIERLNGGTAHRKFRPRSDKAYVRRIYVVWRKLAEAGAVKADGLTAFVRNQTGVDTVEWLSPSQGNHINEALKAMAQRKGVSLDRR